MITNAILLVFQGFLNLILSPLAVLNIAIDLISSIPVITSFLGVVAYVLPWYNILPIIALIVLIFIFRAGLALIRLIKSFIPTMGY